MRNVQRLQPHKAIAMAVTIAIFAAIGITSGCINDKSWQKYSGMIWHTTWHITYLGDQDMLTDVIDTLKILEHSISAFDSTSTVSRINKQESGLVDVHFSNVYNMSKKIHKISNGMFDPTLSRLIEAWGFGKTHTVSPDTARIEELLASTGIDKTWIEDGILFKSSPEIEFNFSALAKGYGVDVASRVLTERGCSNHMVEIGGEVACHGTNPEGKRWRIRIDTPEEEYLRATYGENNMPAIHETIIVELNNEGLATSGNYRNFHTSPGRPFGHTISAKTGRPILTDILSASVIAPTCMEADAAATACMAMGSSDGMAMLLEEGLAGAFILNTGEVIYNEKMKEHMIK